MQARYYDPVIGRFYSNDPVGYVASNPVMSFNRYLYVNNNPYKYVDPDGREIVYAGLTYGANAGVSAAGAGGIYLNFTSDGVEWGLYSSGEAGTMVASPSAGAGLELGYFHSDDADIAMSGSYMSAGGKASVPGASVSVDGVSTLPSKLGGETAQGGQITFSIEATPGGGGTRQHNGAGLHKRIGGISFREIKQNINSVVDHVSNKTTEIVNTIKERLQ